LSTVLLLSVLSAKRKKYSKIYIYHTPKIEDNVNIKDKRVEDREAELPKQENIDPTRQKEVRTGKQTNKGNNLNFTVVAMSPVPVANPSSSVRE
jgi:hypothetical protein